MNTNQSFDQLLATRPGKNHEEVTRRKVGFVASSFDLLHAGHVLMLREARSHCDYLIAALQTDPTLDRPEKNQPVQSIYERYVQLAGCRWVDEIVVYATEQDLIDVISSVPIDVRFLGEEYRDRDFTGRELCQDLGIELWFNSRNHRFASSELRQRINQIETTSRGRS